MFQTGLPPIIRSSKLRIQRQAFVRPLLLCAASRPATSTYLIRNVYLHCYCSCSELVQKIISESGTQFGCETCNDLQSANFTR